MGFTAIERQVLRTALLIRRTEEALLELFSEGSVSGTIHTCIGQELSAASVCHALRPGDTVFSNHRCHGHYLAFTGDVSGLVAEVMGKASGTCGGRGGSQHLCKDGFYSNGVLASTVPIAAGAAFAHKLDGRGHVSVVFVGDGALGEGVLYETLNIAVKWELPLLVVLEDNGYAQSTPQHEALAGDIDTRATAFGMQATRANTWDWRELCRLAFASLSNVRSLSRPLFLHVDTYRLKAHSKGDDLRASAEVESYEARDPLNRMLAKRIPELEDCRLAVELDVSAAIESAMSAEVSTLPVADRPPRQLPWIESDLERRRMAAALQATFADLMASHPKMLFIGEDVRSPYGGAYKASLGLSDRFSSRVVNTPISEAALVGIGIGLALGDYRPIVEIMFGDFLTLAMDQLVNSASKMQFMYNDQVAVNLVIRTPMGGRRGYGPTHSQTLDRHFIGVPGLRVVALNSLVDPALVYGALLEEKSGPTLVIENKVLYTRHLGDTLPAGFRAYRSRDAMPVVHVRPDAPVAVTLIGYGGMLDELLTAVDLLFEQHDVIAQIICPVQIYPFSILPLVDMIKTANVICLVEEGQGFAGFGAEVLAQLAEHDHALLRHTRRVVAYGAPVPASPLLERQALPDASRIVEAVCELISAH